MTQVVVLVGCGSLVENQIVKITEPVNQVQDWVRTNKGQYIQRDWIRRINGSPV